MQQVLFPAMPRRLYAITGLVLVMLTGCASHRPVKAAPVTYEVVIPHDCVTTDIVCIEHPNKAMSCHFERYKDCMVVRVAK